MSTPKLEALALSLAVLCACTDNRELGIFDSNSGDTTPDATTGSDDTETEGGDEGPPLLDLGGGDEGMDNPCGEGMDCECNIPPHNPCDDDPEAGLAAVMGMGCPNEFNVDEALTGNPMAMGTRTNFGSADAFPAREGGRFVVLGSGFVADLDQVYDPLDPDSFEEPCSQDLDVDFGNTYDVAMLPEPLSGQNVGQVDCEEDPSLVGMGDCSNTIESQLDGGLGVFDYTELRTTLTVPPDVYSFSFDLAFFSYEYPYYFNSEYNDMFIGWLESENWTGNVSFDEMGSPISLNAGYLDYKDHKPDPDFPFPEPFPDPDCADGCDAPEIHGTCMQGHAGTKWLTTTASVVPNEEITVVFSIFDQSDSMLDSYVFLDNFAWGCEGGLPPTTIPIP